MSSCPTVISSGSPPNLVTRLIAVLSVRLVRAQLLHALHGLCPWRFGSKLLRFDTFAVAWGAERRWRRRHPWPGGCIFRDAETSTCTDSICHAATVTDFSRRPRRFLPLFSYVHLASLCGQSGITLRIISGDFSAGLFVAVLKTLNCTPDTRHRSHVSVNHDIPPRLRHPANYVDWEVCATRYRASSTFEGFLNTNNNP